MTTTTQAHGGGARPASIDTSGKIAGGVAMRVYGFASAADAQAAGYICEGGPAVPVALITDAQIASGAWRADGDPSVLVVYTSPANLPVEGGLAVPVYSVNGWGSAAPVPVGPLFVSAEVGTVNASTVAVTFDQDISASDYSAGVTIKVNGTATSITSATRQANHAIVYYVIPVLWHGSGDVVTWEYAQASGNIIAEDDSTPLANVTAQSVTNNCEYAGLLDLQADTLALNDSDPVSTWADQSGNGRDFTASGTARPVYTHYSGIPEVDFDGIEDWMQGSDFADNLDSMTVFLCVFAPPTPDEATSSPWISKISTTNDDGWIVRDTGDFQLQGNGATKYIRVIVGDYPLPPARFILAYVVTRSTVDIYVNGDNSGQWVTFAVVPVSNYHNTVNVILGATADPISGDDLYGNMNLRAAMICAPAPSAANRAALEARLAARYGVTL